MLREAVNAYEREGSAISRYLYENPLRRVIRWPGNHHLIRLAEIPQGNEDEINREVLAILPPEITNKFITESIHFSHLLMHPDESSKGLPPKEFLVLTGVSREA